MSRILTSIAAALSCPVAFSALVTGLTVGSAVLFWPASVPLIVLDGFLAVLTSGWARRLFASAAGAGAIVAALGVATLTEVSSTTHVGSIVPL